MQNIWQQIILLSLTVMHRIFVWPKIWTLSWRLSLRCNVQLMIKNKNIFRVIIAKKKNWFTQHETDRLLNNHCQECVRAWYLRSMIVYLFFTRSLSAIIGPKLCFTRSWSAIIGTKQSNRKLISLHNNGEVDKQAHEFANF